MVLFCGDSFISIEKSFFPSHLHKIPGQKLGRIRTDDRQANQPLSE